MPFDFNLTEAQQQRLLQVAAGACYLLIACYAGFILYLVSGFWITPGWFYRTGIPAGADFVQIWAASMLALDGHPTWIYNPAVLKTAETAIVGGTFAGYLPWHYPPSFLFLALPTALLPYPAALLIWLVVPLAGLVLLVSRLAPHPLAWKLALAFPAIPLNLFYGQGAFLVTWLLGAGLLWLKTWPVSSGILFALILNYKPHLGLLVMVALLCGRSWRSLGALVLTTAALILASTLAFGLDTWLAFLKNLSFASLKLRDEAILWDRMPTVFAAIRLLGGSARLALAVQLIVTGGTVALVAWVWRRGLPLAVRGAVLVLGTLLINPYAFDYDLTLLVLPLAWFVWEIFPKNGGIGDILIFALVYLSPVLTLYPVQAAKFNPEPLLIAVFMLIIAYRGLRQAPGLEAGAKTITPG
jgi:hypothetical protein